LTGSDVFAALAKAGERKQSENAMTVALGSALGSSASFRRMRTMSGSNPKLDALEKVTLGEHRAEVLSAALTACCSDAVRLVTATNCLRA
jgi:hypothetical protein